MRLACDLSSGGTFFGPRLSNVTFLSFFKTFLTWWGLLLLGALDSSLVFIPFGSDAVVVYLSARNPTSFWLWG
jgi:hypothetical protein